MIRTAVLIIGLSASTIYEPCLWSQDNSVKPGVGPDATPLHISTRTEMQVPSFDSQGAPQCDEGGNVYFFMPDPIKQTGTILSISSLTGSRTSFFPLPSQLQKLGMQRFFVTPSGSVFVLYQPPVAAETFLATYTKNGTLTATKPLLVPKNMAVEAFAVSDDENAIFVSGHYSQDAPAPLSNSPFIAVFDAAGKGSRIVEGIDPSEIAVSANTMSQQAVTSGRDGMFYLLTPKHVMVLNQAAQVIRTISIPRPTPDANVFSIRNSGKTILVSFLTEGPAGSRPDLLLESFDRQTGQLDRSYAPSSISNVLLCFDQQQGFTFLKNIDGKRFFVQAGQ
jgi:hypothetical protein